MNIDRLLLQRDEVGGTIPPLDQWQPPLSGDMNLRIHADGSWWHEGRTFARPKVARLLATLLRLDEDGYCLVTPVERSLPSLTMSFAWMLSTRFLSL